MQPTTDPHTPPPVHPPETGAIENSTVTAPRADAAGVQGHRHANEHELVVKLDENTKLAEKFDELNLSPRVLDSVKAAGYTKPTPIQSLFIPHVMTGRDVMGQAQTGTGKTAAFLLPSFETLTPGGNDGKVQALILAPTRELAMQIQGEIVKLGLALGFSSITLYGGSSYEPQIEALKRGVDIVVGTPGRIMDHMKSHRLDLSAIKIAVLDEADRMLDLGFRKDIEYILKHCPKSRQTLLLSATIPDDIRKLARRFMHEPIEVWTAVEKLSVDAIEQFYLICERDQKLPTLLKLLEVEQPALGIVFCGTKMNAKRLAERLNRVYIAAKEIHGDLQQSRREKIMQRFRSGQVNLLIATDVASRGIDVNDITHIFNYDIPYKIEDYVHRVGRTGRIGKSGKAFTFVSRDEAEYLTEIEILINRQLIPVHFDDLTSKWWPIPPSKPPEGFEHEHEEYIGEGASAHGGRSGGGRDKKRGRAGRDRREGRESRAGRGGKSHASAHAPAAAHAGAHPPAQSGALPEHEAAGVTSEPITADQIFHRTIGEEARPMVHDSEPRPAHEPRLQGSGRAELAATETHSEKRGGRGRRVRIPIVCARCGAHSTVNFEPDPARPVFCSPCHKIHKAEREKLAAEQAVAAGASHLHEFDPHVDYVGPVPSDALLPEDAAGIPSRADGGLGGAEINLFD
ncbi:MAG TPA: DEAD/DEAH box helicase [Planctomycetota bacterium]|nr:DEAD/DEAH box helicase [Planctomycetota bacterium]